MNMNKKQNQIVFEEFKRHYKSIKSMEELRVAKKAFNLNYEKLGNYKPTVKRFLNAMASELKNTPSVIIEEPKIWNHLNFNLKGLNKIEHKISKLDNMKLKYEFQGLFNLLSDECNLVYNPLGERKKIIKDLNKFKSLRFFKVSYLSRYDLKNEYKSLSFKNDATVGHTKIHFIKSGLYVLKTLKKDDIVLKVFYIGSRYKMLLKSSNNFKMSLKGDKFNLSSTEAYKTLDKKDNMKYYSYCNSIGLDRTNRQLLRSIRRSKKISRESLIDSLESRKCEIMEDIKDCSNLEVLYYELELQDIEKSLSDLKSHDEDNSLEEETFLNDYF